MSVFEMKSKIYYKRRCVFGEADLVSEVKFNVKNNKYRAKRTPT